jgi:nucleoside-diphosphate-sugar epimerase
MAESVPVYMHESVSFVYADGGESWLSEDVETDDGCIALLRAILEGERVADHFTKQGGRGIVLRFGVFYGVDAPSTMETVNLMRKRMLPRIGASSNYFSSIYTTDAGRAVAAALDAPAGIYNVVDDEPVRFSEYLHAAARATGSPAPFRLPGLLGKVMFGAPWKYLSRLLRVSNARLKDSCNWKPMVRNVDEGWALIAAELG